VHLATTPPTEATSSAVFSAILMEFSSWLNSNNKCAQLNAIFIRRFRFSFFPKNIVRDIRVTSCQGSCGYTPLIKPLECSMGDCLLENTFSMTFAVFFCRSSFVRPLCGVSVCFARLINVYNLLICTGSNMKVVVCCSWSLPAAASW